MDTKGINRIIKSLKARNMILTWKIHLTIKIAQMKVAVNQCALTHFYSFLSKFSDVYYKPFFLWIFFRILKLFFILLRRFIADNPLYFQAQVLVMIIRKNPKSKKHNIFKRFKSNCIKIRAIHVVVIIEINLFKSLPYLWLLKTIRSHNK